MEHIGIDVHKNSCQVCGLTKDGELVERRIKSERTSLYALFKDRLRARLLIESSTEGEWVARCLEELGHQVIVADPNFAPMYAASSKKMKTDRRATPFKPFFCAAHPRRLDVPQPGGW